MTTANAAPETHATRLRLATTRLFRAMRQQSDVSLTLSQLACLGTISRQGPLPIGVLAEEERIAAPTATKVVDKLCRAGYVERRGDPVDRRVTLVSVSKEGREFLKAYQESRTAWLSSQLAALPTEDYRALVAALDVLERLSVQPAGPTETAEARL